MLSDKTARVLLQQRHLAQRLDADDGKNVEGTLGYLKKPEPRFLMYTARGFNRFTVAPFCPGLVGRDFYDNARKGSDCHRMVLAEGGCPVLVNNRIAYALAGCFWGGRDMDRMARWSLGASDFPRTTRG